MAEFEHKATQGVTQEPDGTITKKKISRPNTTKVPKVQPTKQVKRGRAKFDDTDIICINETSNPKRKGSKAYDNYQVCLDHAGLTVGEFRAAGGYLPELNYNVKKGFIFLDTKVLPIK